MAEPSEVKVSLKLFIDKKKKRVLFAEANKNAVDFLFHILTLPMGAVIKFLTTQEMVGSLGNMYESIENLNGKFFEQHQTKDRILNPTTPIDAPFSSHLLGLPPPQILEKTFYRCSNINCLTQNGVFYFSDQLYGTTCPGCYTACQTTCKMTYAAPRGKRGNKVTEDQGGFVKGEPTYMIKDDLVVKPISTVALLEELKGKDAGILEEKMVDIGNDEALKLLKASLMSDTVLTDVFLSE